VASRSSGALFGVGFGPIIKSSILTDENGVYDVPT
jgi:hypothetical protein